MQASANLVGKSKIESLRHSQNLIDSIQSDSTHNDRCKRQSRNAAACTKMRVMKQKPPQPVSDGGESSLILHPPPFFGSDASFWPAVAHETTIAGCILNMGKNAIVLLSKRALGLAITNWFVQDVCVVYLNCYRVSYHWL